MGVARAGQGRAARGCAAPRAQRGRGMLPRVHSLGAARPTAGPCPAPALLPAAVRGVCQGAGAAVPPDLALPHLLALPGGWGLGSWALGGWAAGRQGIGAEGSGRQPGPGLLRSRLRTAWRRGLALRRPSPRCCPVSCRQVAERSLFLWNNEYIVQLVAQVGAAVALLRLRLRLLAGLGTLPARGRGSPPAALCRGPDTPARR